MQPYQQRVIDEKAELDDKRTRLEHFIEHNATYKALPADEQHRLSQQAAFMWGYSMVLGARIAHFT